jgi:hypothetical protein
MRQNYRKFGITITASSIGPDSKQHENSPQPHITYYFVWIHSNIIFTSSTTCQSSLLYSRLPTKSLYASVNFPPRATCHDYPTKLVIWLRL